MHLTTIFRLLAGLLACAVASAALAQEKPAPAPSPDDIVVSGRLGSETLKNPLPGSVVKASRASSSEAFQFVRCLHGVPPKLQRAIVEGHIRDQRTRDALDKLIQSHVPCYPGFVRPLTTKAGFWGDCNPLQVDIGEGQPTGGVGRGSQGPVTFDMVLCRAPYDRGAIIEDAFHTYAPHFLLRRADTLNREVVDRFRAREEVRGKGRDPMDRRYYDTVSCMVQLEPETAVRLLRTEPGSAQETRLRLQILDRTGYCTGNARNVRVDPYEFRRYIVDAVYHWTIAAKGVETLIPDS